MVKKKRKLKIKFDHQFTKLHHQQSAKLETVQFVRKKELHPHFVMYDTEYKDIERASIANGGDKKVTKHYELKGSNFIVLGFKGDKGIPFTTLRKFSEKSEATFESNIGQEYEIVVKD